MTPPFPFAGELAALSAAMIWAGSTSVFARFGRDVGAGALNLYKNVIAVICLLAVAVAVGEPPPAAPWAYAMLALSGIVGLAIGDTALFAALRHLDAQRTTAIQCLAPPIAAVVAFLFVGEALDGQEALGMAITVVAVLGTVLARRRPGSVPRGAALAAASTTAATGVGILAAVAAATCQGVGVVLSRTAFAQVHVVHGTLMRVVPALVVLAAVTQWSAGRSVGAAAGDAAEPRARIHVLAAVRAVWSERRRGVFLTLAAFAGTFLGLLLMSAGVKYAKAGVATALSSTYPVWIIPIARHVLREEVSALGTFFTVLAAVGVGVMLLA